ncbi:MAG TPA: DUF2269 domain-containing protein [Xanthobacteraceae bacterium]|nr:DUF2269 domain-containing protein [Xanthobacteraceae bacterium]
MLDLIFAIKFVHLVGAAAMLGTWLGVAIFMLLAHRSDNPSVVAVTSRFAVTVELRVMIAAVALQPISGFALAGAIGVSPIGEFWLVLSLPLYALVVVAWIVALRTEIGIRDLTRQAALDSVPLSDAYRALFRRYSALTWPALAGTVLLFLLMTWQPKWS